MNYCNNIVYILRLALIIQEKRVLYVRGRITRIDADLTKRRNWIFTHVGLSALVQEVEVHRWLRSGSEGLTILCCSFLTLVANKWQALWCKAKS